MPFEQEYVGHAEVREVVGDARADHAAPHDHDTGTLGQDD
jgi:hypothetical protein